MSDTRIVEAFSEQKVLILGDLMLDEYLWGEVNRISQEAPVPVVVSKNRTYAPGGASNVATNIVALDGKAILGGLIGEDESATVLTKIVSEKGVDVSGFTPEKERPTTTKTRILAHNQQMLRIDSESLEALLPASERRILEWWLSHLKMAHICILSDYGKGLLSPEFTQKLIGAATSVSRITIVDPKGSDYAKYRGAALITPNTLEAEKASGIEIIDDESLLRAISVLNDILPETSILLTRGARGMSLFAPGEPRLDIKAAAKTVFDVTGAGDTVVSVLALSLAAGADLPTAANLANQAAGIVVQKLGTSSLSREELLN